MTKAKKRTASLFFVASIGIAVFLVVAVGREYVGNLQIQYEIRQQEKRVAELEQQRLATLNLLNSLSSEYYLEQEGRTKQGLVLPGEEVIVIAGGDDREAAEQVRYGIKDLKEVSLAKRWLYYLFNKEVFAYLKTL